MRFFILVIVFVVFLNIIYDDNAFGQNYTTIILATDDAFVISDLNDPRDEQGFSKTNTGKLDFLKVWYGSSNVNQKIIRKTGQFSPSPQQHDHADRVHQSVPQAPNCFAQPNDC